MGEWAVDEAFAHQMCKSQTEKYKGYSLLLRLDSAEYMFTLTNGIDASWFPLQLW